MDRRATIAACKIMFYEGIVLEILMLFITAALQKNIYVDIKETLAIEIFMATIITSALEFFIGIFDIVFLVHHFNNP